MSKEETKDGLKETTENLERIERTPSKTLVMKTFASLTERIEKTELLTQEERLQLEKLKTKAMERFIKSF